MNLGEGRRIFLFGAAVTGGGAIAYGLRNLYERQQEEQERKLWQDLRETWNAVPSTAPKDELSNMRVLPTLDALNNSPFLRDEYLFLGRNNINIRIVNTLERNNTAQTSPELDRGVVRWHIELSEQATRTTFTPESLALEILHHADFLRYVLAVQKKYSHFPPTTQVSLTFDEMNIPSNKAVYQNDIHAKQAQRYRKLSSVLGISIGPSENNPMKRDAEEFDRCGRDPGGSCWRTYINNTYVNPPPRGRII